MHLSDWLLLLSHTHLRFIPVFSRLDSSFFFLSLNNISLYGGTILYIIRNERGDIIAVP